MLYAGIFSGPRNQTVAPREIVYFNCHAEGTSILWLVNGSVPYPQRDYEAIGFNFTYVEIVPHSHDQLGEENNTIAVLSHPSINNTHIKCRVQGQAHGTHDDVEIEAKLTIIGMNCTNAVFYSHPIEPEPH